MRKMMASPMGSIAAVLGLSLICGSCDDAHSRSSDQQAHQGAKLIASLGCGTCHTIPGVSGANANVGPSLQHIASRIYIAGMLRNNPENLRFWIAHPQAVVPGNAMPDLPMNDETSQKVVAYLETLR